MNKKQALREVIREEIQLLSERFEGSVFGGSDFAEFRDALEREFGEDRISDAPKKDAPVWLLRPTGDRMYTVKVKGVDNAERVQNIADRKEINLNLT